MREILYVALDPVPPETASATPPVVRRLSGWSRVPPRTAARVRRWAGRALLFAPTIGILAVDLGKRHPRVLGFPTPDLLFYFGSVLVGLVLWTSLLAVATRARGVARWPVRALLVFGALILVGGQLYTFQRYQAYVNHRAVLVGTSFLPSIGQQLWFDRWTVVRALLPATATSVRWRARL